eukprot:XP_011676960.1 PREDICTED: toll-like receptor 4 [Strongylocentrotus purpuratus]
MAFLLPLTLQAFQGDSMEIVSSGLHTGSVRRGCYQNVEQRKAYCSNNGLDSVPQNLAGDTKELDLSGNNITVLQNFSFERYPLITFLNLSANDIRVIEPTAFHPLKKLWLLDWLNQNRTVRLANENQTLCAPSSLASLREKPLLHFNPSELCRFNYAIFSLIPIVIVSLVVFLVLVYYKRWKLKYKLFLLKLAVIGYRERLDARNHNDYEFDVNIISYDDDEEWIRENLRPTLEDQLPQFQRNIFGDADLIPGMYYLDAVDYVVSRSYKTIILLSRAAVRDRWFMLKFRTAMDHVSDTQTEFVVVVFLEDIPDDEIPFLARLFLSDGRPYLHWTEDVRGQEYFWKELAKNLTINLRTDDLIPNE